jgi:uncharacterized membrane protein
MSGPMILAAIATVAGLAVLALVGLVAVLLAHAPLDDRVSEAWIDARLRDRRDDDA